MTDESVRNILLWHDPMHIGSADDAYDPEVRRILGALELVTAEEDVAPLVHTIFVEMFDAATAGPIANYVAIGESIWRSRVHA